jgi:predicted nucleic acid-binding protein
VRKYCVDANCYIDATRDSEALIQLIRFSNWCAPGLFLSSVVASELRAGVRSSKERKKLEEEVFGPFVRRGRVVTPTAAAWDALGLTLATLREQEGLRLAQVRRSFALDVLLAYSCRDAGVVLVTGNTRHMERIQRVFAFEFVAPYPDRS